MPIIASAVRIPNEFEAKKKSPQPTNPITTIINLTKETSTIKSLANVGKLVLKIITSTVSDLSNAKMAMDGFGFTADIIKLIGIVHSIDHLIRLIRPPFGKKNLKEKTAKIVSSFLGVNLAILNTFHFIKKLQLFDISAEMGRFSVFSVIPFTSFLSILQLVKNSIDLGLTIHKIKKLNMKILKANEKKQFWKQPFEDILKKKIERLDEKLNRMENLPKIQADKITEFEKDLLAKKTQLKDLQIQPSKKGVVKRYFQNKQIRHVRQSLIKAEKKYHKLFDSYETAITNYNQKELMKTRLEGLAKKATPFTKEDKEKIDTLCMNKQWKWEVKKEIINWEKTKERLGIGLNVIGTIAIIAMLILTATGIGFLAASLTLTSVFLFLTIAGYGLGKFKRYHQPDYVSIPIPEFSS